MLRSSIPPLRPPYLRSCSSLTCFPSLSSCYLQLHNVQLSPGMSKRDTKRGLGEQFCPTWALRFQVPSGKWMRFGHTAVLWMAEQDMCSLYCVWDAHRRFLALVQSNRKCTGNNVFDLVEDSSGCWSWLRLELIVHTREKKRRRAFTSLVRL